MSIISEYSFFGTLMSLTWASSWGNLFIPYANNKGADQPAHLRSLISAFVVRCFDSIIPILAKSKISRPKLVSVAEQAGLNLTWSQPRKQVFLWRGSYALCLIQNLHLDSDTAENFPYLCCRRSRSVNMHAKETVNWAIAIDNSSSSDAITTIHRHCSVESTSRQNGLTTQPQGLKVILTDSKCTKIVKF